MVSDLFKNVLTKITKFSRPYFSLIENDLVFKIDSETFYKYPLDDLEIKTRYDSYVLDAYTIRSRKVFLEYIHTDDEISWNGSSYSFFIDLLKRNLEAKKLELLEEIEFKHYSFYTYKIDHTHILNLIHVNEVNKDVFIVDMKSELYVDLIKKFDKKYEYKFEKGSKNLDLNFSLVRNNAFESYFSLQG